MGLFKKKDKTAHNASPAAVPDARYSHTESKNSHNNPYAYSPHPPSYVSHVAPTYNEPTTYGRQTNEPATYGGAVYNQRAAEPTTYGGSGYGGGNSLNNGSNARTLEPVSYGAAVYANNNNRTGYQSSSNPYSGNSVSSGNNPYGSGNPGGSTGAGAPSQPNRQPQPEPESYSSARGGYRYGGGSYQDSYSGQYQTSALEDEQDPEAIKQEIKYTKYASHASTVNALHAAARAEQAGQSTLLSLDQQGESLYNTQLNLKLAKNHGDIAAHQAKDLKVANRPLFMPHVKNPFSTGQNKALDEQVSLDNQRRERAERASGAKLSHQDKMRNLGMTPVGAPKPISREERAAREKQRSMYQFEADEEDEQLERDIDGNLDLLADASKRLRGIAGDIHSKVEEQNKLILDIHNQAHEVEDGLVRTGQKLRPYGY